MEEFIASKFSLKVVPPLPSLGGPSMHFDSFCSSHFTPSHPNSIVLSSIKLPKWQCNVFPFPWLSIVVEKINTRKWLKEIEMISSFVHQVIPFSMFFFCRKFLFIFWFSFMHLFLPMQVNIKDTVHLVFVNIPRNLLVPLVFTIPSKIPIWNKQVDDYIISIFNFVEKFLTTNGVVLLFHLNDLQVVKEIRSYLGSYKFQIHMKQAIVNSFPFTSTENPSILGLIIFSHLKIFSYEMLQTLLKQITLLVRDLNDTSFARRSFFSSLFEDFLQKGIYVQEEDVIHN